MLRTLSLIGSVKETRTHTGAIHKGAAEQRHDSSGARDDTGVCKNHGKSNARHQQNTRKEVAKVQVCTT